MAESTSRSAAWATNSPAPVGLGLKKPVQHRVKKNISRLRDINSILWQFKYIEKYFVSKSPVLLNVKFYYFFSFKQSSLFSFEANSFVFLVSSKRVQCTIYNCTYNMFLGRDSNLDVLGLLYSKLEYGFYFCRLVNLAWLVDFSAKK